MHFPMLVETVGKLVFNLVLVGMGIAALVWHQRLARAFKAQQKAFFDALDVNFLRRLNDRWAASLIGRNYNRGLLLLWGLVMTGAGVYGIIQGT